MTSQISNSHDSSLSKLDDLGKCSDLKSPKDKSPKKNKSPKDKSPKKNKSPKDKSPKDKSPKKPVSKIRFEEIRELKDSDLLLKFGTGWESRLVIKLKTILDPEDQCQARMKKTAKGEDPVYCRCSRKFHVDSVEPTGHKLCKSHAAIGKNGEFNFKKQGLYTDPPIPIRKASVGPPCVSLVLRKNKDSGKQEISQCGINSCADSTFCTRCAKVYVNKDGTKRELKLASKYVGKPVFPEFKWQCYGTVDEPADYTEAEQTRMKNKKPAKKKKKNVVEESIYDTTDDSVAKQRFEARQEANLLEFNEMMKSRKESRESSVSESESVTAVTESVPDAKTEAADAESEEDSDLSCDDE